MLAQVEIASSGDPLQLISLHLARLIALAERELVQDVRASASIVSQLIWSLVVETQSFPCQSDSLIEADPFLDPVPVPSLPAPIRLRFTGMACLLHSRHTSMDRLRHLIGLDKELQLHLFKLP